jgi:flagellar FlgN protein
VTAVSTALMGREVLSHLDDQLASARRLLATILAQGEAIREKRVEGVVEKLGEIKTEMGMRERLEQERTELLTKAGIELGVPPAGVTLDGLTGLMSPVEAEAARSASAELRGLLGEIAREHGINRALMRQELAFLDHLVRLLGDEPEDGYRPGAGPAPSVHRVLDLQA